MIKNHLKIYCILLMAALFMFMFPAVPAWAWTQLDLSRVKFSSGGEDLVFRFGGLEVYGKLNQVVKFTEEQIDEIIIETMLETGITEVELYESNKQVEKARSYSEISPEMIERFKKNMYTTIKTVPVFGEAENLLPSADEVATILELVDEYMNSSSWDDVGTASATLLEKSMSDWVKNTASGFLEETGDKLATNIVKIHKWRGILGNIYNFCNMLADEYAYDKQKWKDIAEGANAKRLLNEFYQKLQENIDKFKYKSDKKGWRIDFDSKGGTGYGSYTERDFPFFGVGGNKQTWYLDMYLVQTATNEFGSVVGRYEGMFTMRAAHDMSGFTSKAHEAAREMEPIKSIIQACEREEYLRAEVSLTSEGSVNIERTISGSCEAIIDESGDISLTLDEQSDQTGVIVSGIEVEVEIMASTKELGDLTSFTLPYQIGSEDQSLITRPSQLHTATIPSDFNVDLYTAGGSEGNAGWDEEIWRHWDGPYAGKKLSHVGRR